MTNVVVPSDLNPAHFTLNATTNLIDIDTAALAPAYSGATQTTMAGLAAELSDGRDVVSIFSIAAGGGNFTLPTPAVAMQRLTLLLVATAGGAEAQFLAQNTNDRLPGVYRGTDHAIALAKPGDFTMLVRVGDTIELFAVNSNNWRVLNHVCAMHIDSDREYVELPDGTVQQNFAIVDATAIPPDNSLVFMVDLPLAMRNNAYLVHLTDRTGSTEAVGLTASATHTNFIFQVLQGGCTATQAMIKATNKHPTASFNVNQLSVQVIGRPDYTALGGIAGTGA